jgi:uncharacterized protein involved in high-affinity Fe2+ transport
MIVQNFKQANNDIRIESAESIEDAEKNKFSSGEWTRYFVNNKFVSSYGTFIKFIIEETKRNKEQFDINIKEFMKLRNQMIRHQVNSMAKVLKRAKDQNIKINVPGLIFDEMLTKIDERGLRVHE